MVRVKRWRQGGDPSVNFGIGTPELDWSYNKEGEQEGLQIHFDLNGQKYWEYRVRDGKRNGLEAWWYVGGTGLDESPNIKKSEEKRKNGKLMSAVVWKPNGVKCPVTNVKDGNGVLVRYRDDGTESGRSIREGRRNSRGLTP